MQLTISNSFFDREWFNTIPVTWGVHDGLNLYVLKITWSHSCTNHTDQQRAISDFPEWPVFIWLSHWYFCCLSDQRGYHLRETGQAKQARTVFLHEESLLSLSYNEWIIIHDNTQKVSFGENIKPKSQALFKHKHLTKILCTDAVLIAFIKTYFF